MTAPRMDVTVVLHRPRLFGSTDGTRTAVRALALCAFATVGSMCCAARHSEVAKAHTTMTYLAGPPGLGSAAST